MLKHNDGRVLKIVGDYPDISFVNPKIFENVTTDMDIAREEIFGPMANAIRVKNFDEAISWINQSN
ncbi:MAG: aldehyde dehydrogenase family protein [Thermodesulfobacteriota bacterium]